MIFSNMSIRRDSCRLASRSYGYELFILQFHVEHVMNKRNIVCGMAIFFFFWSDEMAI